MKSQKSNIAYLTILLAGVAGYCDTATFVAAKEIFSAHVTGNFIVFAYQVAKGSDATVWIKLITFPVFVMAVMTGGFIAGRTGKAYMLLLLQGILLTGTGLAVYLLQRMGIYNDNAPMYSCTMLIVFAMGMQNAFGRLFSKETFGPTTMMTGNVTQASLDLGHLILKKGNIQKEAMDSLLKQSVTIGGFLAGCLLGALFGQKFGLECVCLPGLLLLFSFFRMHYSSQFIHF
jgi:uncharacterized membrane protein YoaK (UPF0700 family)